ncbi:pilin [Patescibacteria group bacterium]|nr:pilin [Patescibacteria group bacterium]MBU2036545.1 pilin [Patescibacteria group bacterium]
MKKYLYILIFVVSLFTGFALKPTNIYADKNSCTAHGGFCNGIACIGENEYVYDENAIPIVCGYQQVCCKTKSQFLSECEEAGGKCFSSTPNPSIYEPLSKSCDSGYSCYKLIGVLQKCKLPGVCTFSPAGSCPAGKKIYSGLCDGYKELCCEYQAPPEIGNDVIKDEVFCDPVGSPTTDVTGEIYTAIGCIPVSSTPEFIAWILRWAIGIGGGIALMLIIVASFQIMTSSGNPEKVQAGKELLTSAIAGLIMLIFAVFILKVIGVDILKLPGLK